MLCKVIRAAAPTLTFRILPPSIQTGVSGMTRWMFRKSSLTALAIFLFFVLAPHVFLRYPQTVPVALAFVWVDEKMMHGFAVFALMAAAILLHSLIGDLHKWLTRTPEVAFASIPSPAELEAGAATRPHTPLDPEPGATGTAPFISPTSSETKISPALRAGLLVMTSLTFIYDLRQRKTVSLEKPLFDNVSAVLWYFLGGFEVLFVCFLLLVACKLRSRGAAGALQMQEQPAASIEPSVEVLFEEGTGPVPEATAKEKEYSDADKA